MSVAGEELLLIAASEPLWLVAEAPVAEVSVVVDVSVAPKSPLSLCEQPAKQTKAAANNANFFISNSLLAANALATCSLRLAFTRTEEQSRVPSNSQRSERRASRFHPFHNAGVGCSLHLPLSFALTEESQTERVGLKAPENLR